MKMESLSIQLDNEDDENANDNKSDGDIAIMRMVVIITIYSSIVYLNWLVCLPVYNFLFICFIILY